MATLLVATLGLAACGRKGPLDPPPSAGLAPLQPYAARPSLGEEGYSPAPPPAGDRTRAAAAAPPPATEPPAKKTFFLDFLLAK